jgi:hypothetical protein
MTQTMMKQEPRHPTTASLCSVSIADDACAEESYGVKTTRRGTPTKKNTRAVDDKSTSLPTTRPSRNYSTKSIERLIKQSRNLEDLRKSAFPTPKNKRGVGTSSTSMTPVREISIHCPLMEISVSIHRSLMMMISVISISNLMRGILNSKI